MKLTSALVVGLALTALAAPASAQWRDNGRHMGGPGARGFPPPREQPRAGPPPGVQPPRGGPARPSWETDSLGAGWSPQQDQVRAGVNQRRYVPLGQAIDTIRRRSPGRELDAGLEQWDGRAAYRVRWAAPDGRRIDYMVDAESGAILSADGGQ
jgi:peptidase YpeB-like protein